MPRVPAAEIEAAVVGKIRALLKAPEVIISTWKGARPELDALNEGDVRDAVATLVPLWAELFPAEQARVIQLLVERIELSSKGLQICFRERGLAHTVAELRVVAKNRHKATA